MSGMEALIRAANTLEASGSSNILETSSNNNEVVQATTTMATDRGSAIIQTSTTVGPNSQDIQETTTVTEIILPTIDELMTDNRNITCPAGGCGKVLSSTSALRMHLNKTHRQYENPEEKDLFSQKYRMMSKPSATIVKHYYCPVNDCQRSQDGGKPFTKMSLLKQHYVGVHAEKTHKCSKCSAKFGMEKIRIKHEETCGVFYKCSCDAEYATKGALLSHAKYRNHELPANVLLRPLKQQQKELQKQQEQLQKLQRREQRKKEMQIAKIVARQIEAEKEKYLSAPPSKSKTCLQPLLPRVVTKISPVIYTVPVTPAQPKPAPVSKVKPAMKSITTQTSKSFCKRLSKKLKTTTVANDQGIQNKKPKKEETVVLEPAAVNSNIDPMHNIVAITASDSTQHNFQDSGMNTSAVSATHIETQTPSSGLQSSTNMCTQTQGDVIVRNALLLSNIETQTSRNDDAEPMQSTSSQFNNMFTAETQTNLPSLSLPINSIFSLDEMSSQSTMNQVESQLAVKTQTSTTNTPMSSSNAQTDEWLALFNATASNTPSLDSPASDLTQPADVPTQTDLSFLDVLNLSHTETQTMNSLASFMTESSSTQTPQLTLVGESNLQSTEVQTQAGLAGPLNTSQTQTNYADLCLGDVFLSESQSQTSPSTDFRLEDSLSSSNQQTQTGVASLAQMGHQGTQTAAEKELDAALSLLNRYTQTNQRELRNDSPRPDSLSELEFTSMHTQTIMEDVFAVLDNDNTSTSVQTDFEMFSTSDQRSFGVSTENQTPSPAMNSNSVQTDTLELSSFQDLDFLSNASSSSQT